MTLMPIIVAVSCLEIKLIPEYVERFDVSALVHKTRNLKNKNFDQRQTKPKQRIRNCLERLSITRNGYRRAFCRKSDNKRRKTVPHSKN